MEGGGAPPLKVYKKFCTVLSRGGGSCGALTRTEQLPAVGTCSAKTTVESEVPAISILTGYAKLWLLNIGQENTHLTSIKSTQLIV